MAGQDIGALLADLTTRQREGPGPRNRAINIYSINSETVVLVETFSPTVYSTPFYWYDGSSGTLSQLYWNDGVWAS